MRKRNGPEMKRSDGSFSALQSCFHSANSRRNRTPLPSQPSAPVPDASADETADRIMRVVLYGLTGINNVVRRENRGYVLLHLLVDDMQRTFASQNTQGVCR